jgi:hypothetical protein
VERLTGRPAEHEVVVLPAFDEEAALGLGALCRRRIRTVSPQGPRWPRLAVPFEDPSAYAPYQRCAPDQLDAPARLTPWLCQLLFRPDVGDGFHVVQDPAADTALCWSVLPWRYSGDPAPRWVMVHDLNWRPRRSAASWTVSHSSPAAQTRSDGRSMLSLKRRQGG